MHLAGRCQRMDRAGDIHVGKKTLFFASLPKLLSLERKNKLSLYSLTAVFFCGRKRKRNKKIYRLPCNCHKNKNKYEEIMYLCKKKKQKPTHSFSDEKKQGTDIHRHRPEVVLRLGGVCGAGFGPAHHQPSRGRCQSYREDHLSGSFSLAESLRHRRPSPTFRGSAASPRSQ